MDHHKRTLAKTISWRVLATLITITIVFTFTGNVRISLGVGAFEVIAKLIFYYLHERLWNRLNWGRRG
ncbi:MAG TPA: DUF2061 domain-containing protein [Candidatus Nanoarchaeia archaeon]|nr:DUF2061 domain-containing protein [Candidatus Nanoarchaeia archaeon]